MTGRLRNLLPKKFTRENKFGLTVSPADLYDLLCSLFAEERKNLPGDDFLAYHGTDGSIFHRIQTFNWCAPFLPVKGKVLDWGCNHATDSCLLRAYAGDALERFGCDVIEGTEYPVFYAAAQMQYSKLTHHVRLPYEDGMFDAVMASGVLEHVPFDHASLQELYRVLKPEAPLIITYLPNLLSIEEWKFEHVKKSGFHMRRYLLSRARRLLKHNGFFPVKWGMQTYLFERHLARFGIRNSPALVRLLYTLFPLHWFTGCMQLVAVKKSGM